MCGRYALFADTQTLATYFGVAPRETQDAPAPTWNAAPSNAVLTIQAASAGNADRTAVMRRWGFVPHWADGKPFKPLINARSETAARLPAFRDAYRNRRCLVPANGFYEWTTAAGAKTPVWIHPQDGTHIAFAAIWSPAGGENGSVAIITTAANALMRPIHSRMPVILPPQSYDAWLSPATPPDDLAALCASREWQGIITQPVGSAVNSPLNDGPSLIQPAPTQTAKLL